jgi:hypothetical protein
MMSETPVNKHRHAFRATHVKTQGIVKGKLTVNEGLPEHLAQVSAHKLRHNVRC